MEVLTRLWVPIVNINHSSLSLAKKTLSPKLLCWYELAVVCKAADRLMWRWRGYNSVTWLCLLQATISVCFIEFSARIVNLLCLWIIELWRVAVVLKYNSTSCSVWWYLLSWVGDISILILKVTYQWQISYTLAACTGAPLW